jgi:hypothetical protein
MNHPKENGALQHDPTPKKKHSAKQSSDTNKASPSSITFILPAS